MNQRGEISLVIVFVLTIFLAIWQCSSELLLQNRIIQLHNLRAYLQARLGAISALSWGLQQSWPPSKDKLCLNADPDLLQSCFYRINPRQGVLSGRHIETGYRLWQRVWVIPGEAGKVQPMSSGWIDICPLPEQNSCQAL